MVNQFKPASVEDYRLKTNVLLYLIGTQFMTVRKDIGFFTKEQWQETAMRINQLLDLVSLPAFEGQLKKALEQKSDIKEKKQDKDEKE